MRTTKMIVTVAIAPVFLAGIAIAETYTFEEVESQSWDEPSNWTPNTGPPGAGDTAIIPSGETCIVKDDDQAAEVIRVTGTLGLEGKSLTLGDPLTPTTSIVDGTIYFKKVDTPVGRILVADEVSMLGSGTLTAKVDDGREGCISVANLTFNPQILILGAGMTIEGTFFIRSGLELNGTAIVDSDKDTIRIGQTVFTAGGEDMRGSGEFQVSAGLLKFGKMIYGSTLPDLTLSGGEIEFIDVPVNESTFLNLTFAITMTGGTLDINDPFDTTAECIFSGGTIEVADGKCAEFKRPA